MVYIDPINSIDGGNNMYWLTPPPQNNGGLGWVSLDQNYLKIPAQPIFVATGIVAMGSNVVNINDKDKEKKIHYKRTHYPPGKYKTSVRVLEGSVYVADYDEKGPDLKNSTEVKAGQKASRTGEVS